MYSTTNAEKVVSKQKTKRKSHIHLYLPPLLSLTELSVVLTGERGQIVKTTSVVLLFTYLFKNVLFNQDRDTERWVEVSRRALRTILGTDYCEVVDTLIKTNFLERLECNEEGVVHKHNRGHYWNCPSKPGECKKYRIHPRLLSPDKLFKVVKEPVTTLLTNKVASLNKPIGDDIEKYRELALYNMSDIILLDTPACRLVLDELFAQGSIKLTADDYLETINNYIFAVPIVCDFGHRAHHRVVRLNRRLRPFLYFRDALDSPLVELDFVASQPSIIANIDAKLIKKYAPECASAIPLFAKYEKKSDYQNYQRLCFNGTIYEHLRDEYNKEHGAKLAVLMTRDDAKNICYNAFFSNYQYREAAAPIDSTEARLRKAIITGTQAQVDDIQATLFKKRSYELFKRLFPSVHALFAAIKALDWSSFNPGEQHSNNCLLAQRIESGLIYTRFVAALVAAGITRFTTSHDAINVKAQDEEKARKIILREVKKMGLQMNLKTKVQDTPVPITSAPAPILPSLRLPVNLPAPVVTAPTDDELLTRLEAEFACLDVPRSEQLIRAEFAAHGVGVTIKLPENLPVATQVPVPPTIAPSIEAKLAAMEAEFELLEAQETDQEAPSENTANTYLNDEEMLARVDAHEAQMSVAGDDDFWAD